jgi:hypothetical protein
VKRHLIASLLDMHKKDDKNIFFIPAVLPDKTVNGLSSL